MHPILFKFPEMIPLIGGKGIHLYGIMIAMGFMAGLWWIKRESRREGLSEDKVMDLFFYIILSGVLGARILYIINSTHHFWDDPLMIFRIWEGGLVFQGGLILAILVVIWYCRKHQLKFLVIADIFSPALALGHAFGRIGCFFAGCCFGREAPASFPLSIIFPAIEGGIAPSGIPLYPTQLMESAGEFLIFFLLMTYRKKKSFNGAVFLLYIILYAILRSTLEIFRGDTIRGFVIEPYLSRAQLISLIMMVGAVFIWIYLRKKQVKRIETK